MLHLLVAATTTTTASEPGGGNGTSTLSIVSIVVAFAALAVTLTGLLRWPKITARWDQVQDDPPHEALVVTVTARRRPIHVKAIGHVRLPRTWRRRVAPWLHVDRPPRTTFANDTLPARLEDGDTITGLQIGEDEDAEFDLRGSGVLYVYVEASGVVYLRLDPSSRRSSTLLRRYRMWRYRRQQRRLRA